MNDPPIPFIAYFFITVTAGTLAYATFTDKGVEDPSASDEAFSDEIKPSDNSEQINDKPLDMEYIEKPMQQDPSDLNKSTSESAPEKTSEDKSLLPQISLSNPFMNQTQQQGRVETKENNDPKESKGIFDTLGLATKPVEQKGGKSKKKHRRKNNKTKKNKSGKKMKKK